MLHRALVRLFVLSLFTLVPLAALLPARAATTGEIAGIVKDTRGRLVRNALVRITGGPVEGADRTDGQGRYLLAALPAGEYSLVVQKPGYATAQRGGVAVTPGQTTAVNFRPEWAEAGKGAIEVIVQDASQDPLSGAAVTLRLNGGAAGQSTSDDFGTAGFAGLRPGTYSVGVSRAGFLDASVDSVRVQARVATTATVRLARDVTASGRLGGVVQDLNGASIRGAVVRILSGISRGQTTTAAGGQYQFDDLIPGDGYALQVSAAGYASQTLGSLSVRTNQVTVAGFTLVSNVPTRGSLTGQVKDNAGRAVAFATLTLTAGPVVGRQAQSGVDGRYVFTSLPPSSGYAVVAEANGYVPAGASAITVAAGQSAVVDLVLRSGGALAGSISGLVRERGSGRLLSGAVAEILQGPSAGLAATADASGHYVLNGVLPGANYILRFSKDGYDPATTPFVIVQAGLDTAADGHLSPRQAGGGSITGKVRRFSGGPLAGARVSITAGPTSPLQTTTRADGTFEFTHLLAGTGYTLRAEKPGLVTSTVSGIQVQANQEVTQNFVLRRGTQLGGIGGKVVDLLQNPIRDATVRVVSGPVTPDPVQTDAAGVFLLDSLPAGAYTLQVTAGGFRLTRQGPIFVSPPMTASTFILMLR